MGTHFFSLFRPGLGTAAVAMVGAMVAGPASAAEPSIAPPGARVAAQQAGVAALARGTIGIQLDLGTLTAVPTSRGANCQLRVEATLELAGTVDGTAAGVTVATVLAPCAAATLTPPGTFADTFRFTGRFQGAVSGVPSSAGVVYSGVTRPGGEVSALLLLHGGTTALTAVQARGR